ncbi:MAG: ABC transporter substrate-binding protein [Lachnospiraceae bacterium]|nr:ABC transporter substrate-binding protein [Lachnospiraceae bacterium]MBQ7602235.1 ABC transporter substrate-binding protein [Lachnospiraceae bacterium]
MKKLLALLLAMVMVLSLAACGGTAPADTGEKTQEAEADTQASENEAAEEGEQEATEDSGFPKLRINLTSFTGEAPTYAKEVQDALNELLRVKAQAEVEFVWIGFSDMKTQLNLLLTGGDDSIDILSSFWYTSLGELVSNGQVAPLDDLLESSGQGIKELYSDFQYVLDCGRINGTLYGIPSFTAWSSPNIYICEEAVAEGVDFSTINTVDDLTAALVTMKEHNPDKYFIPGATEPYWVPKGIDYLGDTNYLGCLMDPCNSTTVENYYESDYFINFLDNVKIWKEKGIISPDSMSNPNPTLLSFQNRISYGTPGYGYNMVNFIYEANKSQQYGADITGCEIGDRLLTTGNINTYLWHVTSFCKDKEAAMRVLNCLYTDSEVANVFSNGVEGLTYGVDDNGQLCYINGATDANSAGWSVGYAYVNPNDFLCPTWDYQLKEANDLMVEDNAKALPSLALGFTCDLSPVADQYSACVNVIAQYYNPLMNGEVDIDEVLPEFQQALRDAGVDQIVAEKQRQLDEWLANK